MSDKQDAFVAGIAQGGEDQSTIRATGTDDAIPKEHKRDTIRLTCGCQNVFPTTHGHAQRLAAMGGAAIDHNSDTPGRVVRWQDFSLI
jgi:hypothetical protein